MGITYISGIVRGPTGKEETVRFFTEAGAREIEDFLGPIMHGIVL